MKTLSPTGIKNDSKVRMEITTPPAERMYTKHVLHSMAPLSDASSSIKPPGAERNGRTGFDYILNTN